MDIGHARKVFIDGFLSTRTGFQMELPLVPLASSMAARVWSSGCAITASMCD